MTPENFFDFALPNAVFRSMSIFYWLFVAVVVTAVVARVKKPAHKFVFAMVLLAVLVGPVVLTAVKKNAYQRQQQEKLDEAMAHFEMRCKSAGEKIYKSYEGVNGIQIINLRPVSVTRDDQFELYDPYGYEGGGNEYIKTFLAGYWRSCAGSEKTCTPEKMAFSFVEARGPNNEILRYYIDATNQNAVPKLQVEQTTGSRAQFGVKWEDISTKEDRQHWIAGGALKIVDLKTEEVIAERVGYLLDSGLGNKSGGRSPWAWARQYSKSCPNPAEHNFVFVRKVLKFRQQ